MKGKTVLIFGGSGPLGSEVAYEFLKAGANVAVSWNTTEAWNNVRPKFDCYTSRFFEGQVDVSNEIAMNEFATQVKEHFGSIDVMMYMAGFFHIGPMIWNTDTDVFDRMLSVNLRGAFLSAKAVLPAMLEQKQGRIFFFPAKSVLVPQAHFGAYAVTKSGLVSLTESLAEELKEDGITVNAIMPDAVDTYKTRKAPNATPDRWVKPVQIAELLLAACRTESNILNGATLKVFGK